jgi:hypothetical protein
MANVLGTVPSLSDDSLKGLLSQNGMDFSQYIPTSAGGTDVSSSPFGSIAHALSAALTPPQPVSGTDGGWLNQGSFAPAPQAAPPRTAIPSMQPATPSTNLVGAGSDTLSPDTPSTNLVGAGSDTLSPAQIRLQRLQALEDKAEKPSVLGRIHGFLGGLQNAVGIANGQKDDPSLAVVPGTPAYALGKLSDAQTQANSDRTFGLDQQKANTEADKSNQPNWITTPYLGPNGEAIEQNTKTGEQRVSTIGATTKDPAAKNPTFESVVGPDGKTEELDTVGPNGLTRPDGSHNSNPQRYEKPADVKPVEDLQRQLATEEALPNPDPKKVANLQKRLKDLNPQAEQNTQTRVVEFNTNQQTKQQVAADKAAAPYQNVLQAGEEARSYAAEHTGPGDYALMLSFVDATKPKTGFRFTTTEQHIIQSARSLAQGAEAAYLGGKTGELFTPQQRQQMLSVIAIHEREATKYLKAHGYTVDTGTDAGSTDNAGGPPANSRALN